MKVLLVSEGKHELAGSLETLVRRLSPHGLEIDRDRVSNDRIHTHRGKGRGFFKRAVRWMFEARKRGYEAVVLVIDEDGRPERIDELAAAQASTSIEIRRAFGAAIRTFDAWMLADEQALTCVLGRQISRPPAPEDLGDPKQMCKELCTTSAASVSQAEMYAKLANVVSLALLEQRCPKGFASFAARVRTL